jgi:hypothetical protein
MIIWTTSTATNEQTSYYDNNERATNYDSNEHITTLTNELRQQRTDDSNEHTNYDSNERN